MVRFALTSPQNTVRGTLRMGSGGSERSRHVRLAQGDRWHLDRQLDKECSGGSRGERCKGSRVRAYVENRGLTGAEGK